MKELEDEITLVITSLMRQSLSTNRLSKVWKNVWLTPIFKKGARHDPSNYRPVLMTSVICRLMEQILCTHGRRNLATHCILTPANHGFRSATHVNAKSLSIHDLKQGDLGHHMDIGILVFSQVFDTCDVCIKRYSFICTCFVFTVNMNTLQI